MGIADLIRNAIAQNELAQTAYGQNQLNTFARQPIPGLTGPANANPNIPGLLGQQLPTPMSPPGRIPPPAAQFTPAGPYGQQASMLAGLLGGGQMPAPPGAGPSPVGPRFGFRIPGRPYGK